MSKGKNQHVTTHPDGWQVKGENNSKATKVTSTKIEAIKIAKEIAKNQNSELIVHNMDGKFSEKNSYGNKRCPSKDKE